MFNALCFAVPRELKGITTATENVEATGLIRRGILTDCFRRAAALLPKEVPFWLRRGDVQSGHVTVQNCTAEALEVCFQRRERGRACNEKSAKRRNYIGSGSARPTVEDDAEFVG